MSPPEITTEHFNSLPPHGPHTITLHAPSWEICKKFRDGDMSLMMRLKSIYPRFFPFGPAGALARSIGAQLKLPEGHGLVAFLDPSIWAVNKSHATSKFRKEKASKPEELKYYVVDLAGTRLYVVAYPMAKMMSAIFMWQHGGIIFSTRYAEAVLPVVESELKVVGEFADGEQPPPPTYLPEGESHELLRKRISGLLMRSPAQEPKAPVAPEDVYLYQTGMSAIYSLHKAILKTSTDVVVVMGAVFHSSWHLFEESVTGVKHYGAASDADVDDFEKYLEGGGKCSYVFTEVPSNPVLVTADLVRIRKLADKYGFYLVVDDTVGSFCNLDVLPVADLIISSLTKSFSGYADVMCGSVVVNPGQESYKTLKPIFAADFHNQFFTGDADHLLKNSDDYLERSAILNRNASTLAAYFQKLAEDPKVPVAAVCYPPYSPGSKYLQPFLRKPSPEFPNPGYGCLFSVTFESIARAILFYDNVRVHCGPHLGAHKTLAMPYNMVTYGKENPEYHASYGLVEHQIRFSVGLEDEKDLLEAMEFAVQKMVEAAAASGSEETKTA